MASICHFELYSSLPKLPICSHNMFKRLFGEHGAKNVVTLFHAPSNQASTRVLTLLKQANAQSVAHATEAQASSHVAQDKAERTEFELDVTEAPPTTDQLKNILDYLGGTGAAGKVINGAENESDAMRRLKADGNVFRRPLVVDWNQGKAVAGDDESEIMKLIRSIPKETEKV
ncbi:Thioredoxin-like fold [Pyrenophora seminiperda CCB06]|uniref:Thioredoxin-like fold n=1 Tax=Pyrenophora seminiperda CCB06 TaxID=1302712 RepID=A0A3M7MIH3_9PLEO|nr:Thioredoxin-like fold [Pyrenophora seminiperda CCB06]